jgi:hypothetical protein
LKVCKTCGEAKPREAYPPKSAACRVCANAAARLRMAERRATPEGRAAARAAVKKSKAANPDVVLLHRTAARTKAGARPRLDRDVRLRAEHVRRIARWKAEALRVKRTAVERYRWKMATDPAYVVNTRMRVAIKKALRGGKAGRRWESLVGYTLDELVQHLERQMPKGLTLADLGSGRLHIDHIVPKVEFDVTTDEGLRAAWALPNLRPVPAEVNLRKGAKRVTLL